MKPIETLKSVFKNGGSYCISITPEAKVLGIAPGDIVRITLMKEDMSEIRYEAVVQEESE
jgi:hypothetical protein|nr:MAG TPA: RNA polymerase Rpb5-like protein [Caudoviricetes sp.]